MPFLELWVPLFATVKSRQVLSKALLSPKGYTGKVSNTRISTHSARLATSPLASVSTTLIARQPWRSTNSQITLTPSGHRHFALRLLTSFSSSGFHVQMFMKNMLHPLFVAVREVYSARLKYIMFEPFRIVNLIGGANLP